MSRFTVLDGIETVFLDTETTGLSSSDAIVEVSIVGADGHVLLDTRANPGFPIPAASIAVHGITDDDVRDAPTVAEVKALVTEIVAGKRVVAYNAAFDRQFVDLSGAAEVQCALGFVGIIMFGVGLHLTLMPQEPVQGTVEWLAGAAIGLAVIIVRVCGVGWLCSKR